MRVEVALYGSARVIVGQPQVEVSFETSTATLGQLLQHLAARYPRARPYFLDEADRPPSFVRVLINAVRPYPDATSATILHDADRVALLVAVAGGGRDMSLIDLSALDPPLFLEEGKQHGNIWIH